MQDTIGVDISKATLDAYARVQQRHWQFPNNRCGISELLTWIRKLGALLVVFEATGAYHRTLETALAKRNIPFCKVNPRQSRRFAEATGRLAKTDRVDAMTLARMGAVLELPAQAPRTEVINELKELLVARRALVKDQATTKTRAKTAMQKIIQRQTAARLKLIAAQIADLDQTIMARIEAAPDLAARMDILISIPGIAKITAFTMLIEMPELGTLTGKQAASLAGLAPVSRQSGKWRGHERIRGGRAELRRALYMPALVAMRFNRDLHTKACALTAQGKPAKLVITAIMRKLLVLANAVITEGRKWTPECP